MLNVMRYLFSLIIVLFAAAGVARADSELLDRLRQIKENSFPSLDYIEDVYHKVHNFFEIPFDFGEGRVGKFDIVRFCAKYKL